MLGRIIKSIEAEIDGKEVQKKRITNLLTVPDVSKILSCSPHQVYRYLKQGILKDSVIKLGGRTIRFNEDKLRRLIDTDSFH